MAETVYDRLKEKILSGFLNNGDYHIWVTVDHWVGVSAKNKAEAAELWNADQWSSLDGRLTAEDFSQLPDTEELTLEYELERLEPIILPDGAEQETSEDGLLITATAGQWAAVFKSLFIWRI